MVHQSIVRFHVSEVPYTYKWAGNPKRVKNETKLNLSTRRTHEWSRQGVIVQLIIMFIQVS
uniref:Putative inactive shikimate kinase like 1ic isoform X3 n=1 Tax=Rhizophora mucronata TaxID=61149 RepID=A0A2P2KB31_RHIMU